MMENRNSAKTFPRTTDDNWNISKLARKTIN